MISMNVQLIGSFKITSATRITPHSYFKMFCP